MNRIIRLDATQLEEKEVMFPYLKQEFDLPSHMGKNLDALYDCLSEVTEDITVLLTRRNVTKICQSSYAYKVLMILGRIVEENPHIQIEFDEE